MGGALSASTSSTCEALVATIIIDIIIVIIILIITTYDVTHPQQSRLKSSCSSLPPSRLHQAYVIMAEQGNEPQRHGQAAWTYTYVDLGGTMGWAAQPPDGMWVAPVSWRLGSWVRLCRTGHWGYVFRSERNMCYLYCPVPIEQVPEWLRMAAIRLALCRGDERPMNCQGGQAAEQAARLHAAESAIGVP